MDTVIPDERLRKALIDASIKMEEMLRAGQITLDRRIVSKTEWGLEIEIEMSQPKEDKPIIFRYVYRIDRVTFTNWLKDHAYLTEGPLLMFTCRGMDFVITTDKPHKSMASITVKYEDVAGTATPIKYEPPIVEEPVKLVVHREVVNNHDWIVKCIVS
jgi:hypothetical protein